MTELISKAKNLLKNEAVVGTAIVTVGTFVGSIVSYVVQIFLGRNLTVEEYGTFNPLLSLSVIVGILNNTLTTSIVRMVSELKVKARFDTLTQIFIELSVFTLLLGVLFASVFYIFRVPFSRFLNIPDVGIITAFAVFAVTIFIRIVPFSYLQGLLRFKAYAFSAILMNGSRLAGAVAAVYLGYRVGGIYVSIGIFSMLAFFVLVLLLKKNFTSYEKSPLSDQYKRLLAFSGPVFLVQAGMILLNNTDIVLVKHFFNELTAGLYSGLVTVGKVFLFFANTVAVVMFPQIAGAFAEGKNYLEKLKPFFYLQVLVIIGGFAVFSLFPGLIVRIMFPGSGYLPAVAYLPKFALFMGLYVMLNFLSLYLLAVDKVRVYLLFIPAVIVQALLINAFHSSISQVIDINLLVSGVLLIGVLMYHYHHARIHRSTSL